jgi:orotate phosphoribosyltransferase
MASAEDADADRARLRGLLLARAVRRGRVVLASGKVSDFYVDCKQVSLSGEGLTVLGRLLCDAVLTFSPRPAAVGGLTLGADPLVAATALTAQLRGIPLDAFIVRKEPKEHGTAAWLEGVQHLAAGAPTAILEDVTTTGASALRAVDRSIEFGLNVVGVACIVDREEGGRDAIAARAIPFISLFTRRELERRDAES